MLVHIAKRTGESAQRHSGVALRVHGEDATVGVHVVTPTEPSTDLVVLAERCSGEIVREHGELVLRLPSLRELRRREREARGESPTD
jgi:hypothetical protein